MSRFIKEKVVEQYTGRFRDVSDVVVISTQGVDVERMVAFRTALRRKGIRAMVVQNRLCKRALDEVGLEALATFLGGSNTLVWGGDSILDIAKVLVGQAKPLVEMEIRGGISEGQILTKEDIDVLSKMPGREQLIGMAVARAMGQAPRVVALAVGPAGRILGQIRQYEKAAPEKAAEADQAAKGRAPAEAAPEKPDAAGAEPHARRQTEGADGAQQAAGRAEHAQAKADEQAEEAGGEADRESQS